MLKNKKYVISAAADGIGLAITSKIVDNGGTVYLSDIDEKKIRKIKSIKKFKKKVFATKLEANNYEEVKKYFLSLKKLF